MDTIPVEVRQTAVFVRWLRSMRDASAKAAIVLRLRRVAMGNLGDAKPVGQGVSELRVDVGPGYRIYFTRRGARVILLLIGGNKSSQDRDILKARAMLKELPDEDHRL